MAKPKLLYMYNNKGLVLDVKALRDKFKADGGKGNLTLKTDSAGMLENVPFVEEGACLGAVVGWLKHAVRDRKPVRTQFDHNLVALDQSLFKFESCRALIAGDDYRAAKERAFRRVFELSFLTVGTYEETTLDGFIFLSDNSYHHISLDIPGMGAHSMGLHVTDATEYLLFEPGTGLWEATKLDDLWEWWPAVMKACAQMSFLMAPVTT